MVTVRVTLLIASVLSAACSASDRELHQGGAGAGGTSGAVCDHSKPFSQPKAVAELISGQDEMLRLSPDLLTAYWMSTRAGGAGNLDLYSAARVNSKSPFTGITNLSVLNSASSDAVPTATGDGLSIFFESDRGGSTDLYMATRAAPAVAFGAPAPMANVNSSSSDANPFVRQDGQVLYFGSARGGAVYPDIYRATWNGSAFVSPTAVSEINSPDAEGYPAVTPDDLTIYWASIRKIDGGAKGDLDIWTAARSDPSEAFTNVHPVVELNTPADEVPSFVTSDDCTLYISSSHAIYVATREK